MMSIFRKKSDNTLIKSRTFSITIPNSYEYGWEKDGSYDTLMIWKKGSDSTLRLTPMTITPAENFSPLKFITEQHKKYGGKLSKKNNFQVLSYRKEAEQNGMPLIQDYCMLIKENRMFIASFTMEKKKVNNPSIKKEKDEIMKSIFDININQNI